MTRSANKRRWIESGRRRLASCPRVIVDKRSPEESARRLDDMRRLSEIILLMKAKERGEPPPPIPESAVVQGLDVFGGLIERRTDWKEKP